MVPEQFCFDPDQSIESERFLRRLLWASILQFWLRWSNFNRRSRSRITIFGEPTRALRQNTNMSAAGAPKIMWRACQSFRLTVGSGNRLTVNP